VESWRTGLFGDGATLAMWDLTCAITLGGSCPARPRRRSASSLLLVPLLPAMAAAVARMARMARPMEPPASVRAAPRIRVEVRLLCGS
jgi:hypothetical protein